MIEIMSNYDLACWILSDKNFDMTQIQANIGQGYIDDYFRKQFTLDFNFKPDYKSNSKREIPTLYFSLKSSELIKILSEKGIRKESRVFLIDVLNSYNKKLEKNIRDLTHLF